MGLFGASGSERPKSAALFDVGPESVGGACAAVVGGTATLLQSARVPIALRPGEDAFPAMKRAFETLGASMSAEGASALARASGSGRPSRILVSVANPWQKTSIRVEQFADPKGFVFGSRHLNEALAKRPAIPPGYVFAEESVIGTRLNGFDVGKPLGKRALRANVVVLTSVVDERVASAVAEATRRLYHTRAALVTSFAAMVERAFRLLFAPEEEYLVVAKRGEVVELYVIRHGILVDIHTIESCLAAADLARGFSALATEHPLPYRLFLFADEAETRVLNTFILDPVVKALWLSNDPPHTTAIVPDAFLLKMKSVDPAEHDSFLRLLVVASLGSGSA